MSFPRTHTQSSLAAARRCLRYYYLRYVLLLDRDSDAREALLVGQCWHLAHEVAAHGGDPYGAIFATAPSLKWSTKLSRLFAAYGWYWQSQPFAITAAEVRFKLSAFGHEFEGMIDRRLELDGRRGIAELKTSGEDVGDDASYWDRLKMDVQVGLYGLAADRPDFILYDVTRKPGTNPKSIPKADMTRLKREIATRGQAKYFAELFDGEQLADVFSSSAENLALYGARLTHDIEQRPAWYFQRREVARTDRDYDVLLVELHEQVQLLEYAEERDLYPCNPNACTEFGLCEFFSLCSNHRRPARDEEPPAGFRRREHVHSELEKGKPVTP